MLLFDIIVIGVIIVAFYFRARQEANKPLPHLPYVRKTRLLTASEERFWRALSVACRDQYQLACKVRVADVLETRPFSRAAFNKISSKHFDFVLCDPATTRPLLVIELDDASHNGSNAKARDAVKDGACRAAGLPMLRVPVQSQYDTLYLQQRILEMLEPSTISQGLLDTHPKHGV